MKNECVLSRCMNFFSFPVGDGRCPNLRWERIQHGVPGGEADARRQDLPDLRGNRPDPAHHHLQGVAHHRQTENWNVSVRPT